MALAYTIALIGLILFKKKCIILLAKSNFAWQKHPTEVIMAATFPGNEIVRLTVVCSYGGQIGEITKYFSAASSSFDTAWTSQDLFAALITAGLPAAMLNIICGDAVYQGMKLYMKGIGSAPPRVDRDSTGTAISVGDTPLPTQVCGLLRWNASIGGPKGRGRDYMPFPALTDCDISGTPTGDYRGRLAVVGGILFGPHSLPNVGGAGGVINVFPVTKYVEGSINPLPYAFQSFEAATGFATQRRRGFFGQPNSPGL